MSATRRNRVIAVVVAAGILGTTSPASAQPFGRGPARPEVRGTVKTVDASGGTITIAVVEPRQETRSDKTYTLAKDAEVAFGEMSGGRSVFKEGKLSDITPGALVSLTLADDQQTVDGVLAEGPLVRGQLKKVDPVKGTLTISMFVNPGQARGEATTEDKTFALASDAEVGIDDGRGRRFSVKEGKLADLAAGATVSARLSPDQKQAVSVIAEATTLTAIIKSVDAGTNTVTLTLGPTRGGEAGEEKALKLAEGAVVLVDEGRGRRLSVKEARLADVPGGSTATVRLTPDQQSITMLRAEGPNLPVQLKSVNAGQNTITFTVRSGREEPQEKTLPVAADARVVIDNNDKKLADLSAGEGQFALLRLSLDQKTVQSIRTFPQR